MGRNRKDHNSTSNRITKKSKCDKAVIKPDNCKTVLIRKQLSKSEENILKSNPITSNYNPTGSVLQTDNAYNAEKNIPNVICAGTSNNYTSFSTVETPNATSNNTNFSKINNASLMQMTSILPSTAFPSKIVILKIAEPPKGFENIKTPVQNASMNNCDLPSAITGGCYDNKELKAISVKNLTSQPVISLKEKTKNIRQKRYPVIQPAQKKKSQTNVLQQKKNIKPAKSKKRVSIVPGFPPKAQTAKTVPGVSHNGQTENTLQNVPNVTASNLPNNFIVSTVPTDFKNSQNTYTVLRILPKDQSNADTQQENQKTNTTQQESLNVSTIATQQENHSVNTVSSAIQKKESITNEILNTKFMPIKPKPPGYKSSGQLLVTPYKKKQKPRSKAQPEEGGLLKCIVCEKSFLNSQTLLKHQRIYHLVKISTGKSYECRICGKQLSNFQCRYKHEKRFHQEKQDNKTSYKCSECLSDFQNKRTILAHISVDHPDVNLEPQHVTLNSHEEFINWKTTLERDTTSEFLLQSRYKSQDWDKNEYACHRSTRVPRNSRATKRQKIKYKTGLFCPAFLTAKISAASVQVTYNLTHLGHECDVERLPFGKRIGLSQNCKLHRCRVCKKVFSQSANRRLHERSVHGLDDKYELTLKCPICFNVLPSRKMMMQHLSKSHAEVSLESTNLTFESLKEFGKWKLSIEEETNFEYILDQAYRKKMYSFRRFNCHLSGTEENDLFCPASMLVKLSTNLSSVNVSFLSTHISHSGANIQVMDESLIENNSEHLSMKDSHIAAEKIFESVKVFQKEENMWIVLPSENEYCFYNVSRQDVDSSHACEFKCSSCSVCSHQFTCDCSTSLLKSVCIHIHIVYLKHKLSQETEEESSNYEQSDNNELVDNSVQEIVGSLELNNLRSQVITALSRLLCNIKNCNDRDKLKLVCTILSNLNKQIS